MSASETTTTQHTSEINQLKLIKLQQTTTNPTFDNQLNTPRGLNIGGTTIIKDAGLNISVGNTPGLKLNASGELSGGKVKDYIDNVSSTSSNLVSTLRSDVSRTYATKSELNNYATLGADQRLRGKNAIQELYLPTTNDNFINTYSFVPQRRTTNELALNYISHDGSKTSLLEFQQGRFTGGAVKSYIDSRIQIGTMGFARIDQLNIFTQGIGLGSNKAVLFNSDTPGKPTYFIRIANDDESLVVGSEISGSNFNDILKVNRDTVVGGVVKQYIDNKVAAKNLPSLTFTQHNNLTYAGYING